MKRLTFLFLVLCIVTGCDASVVASAATDAAVSRKQVEQGEALEQRVQHQLEEAAKVRQQSIEATEKE